MKFVVAKHKSLTQIFIYKTFKLILVKIKKLNKKGQESAGAWKTIARLLLLAAALIAIIAIFIMIKNRVINLFH